MDFDGYVKRVEFHLEHLGVEGRPTKQAFIDAWNNQIPAKKMAESFSRRHQRKNSNTNEG